MKILMKREYQPYSDYLPETSTKEMRLFFSCYRLSKIRIRLLRTLPVLSVVAVICFPLLSLMLYFAMVKNINSDTPVEILQKLKFLTSGMGLIGVLIGATLFAAYRRIMRHICYMEILCTDNEIIQRFRRKGGQSPKEIRILWSDITKVRKIAFGRAQQATVVGDGKKIKVDASFIEMVQPLPDLKMTWRGEVLRYPDGTLRQLEIKDNDLYTIIQKRTKHIP